jgi:hypothetical protein
MSKSAPPYIFWSSNLDTMLFSNLISFCINLAISLASSRPLPMSFIFYLTYSSCWSLFILLSYYFFYSAIFLSNLSWSSYICFLIISTSTCCLSISKLSCSSRYSSDCLSRYTLFSSDYFLSSTASFSNLIFSFSFFYSSKSESFILS